MNKFVIFIIILLAGFIKSHTWEFGMRIINTNGDPIIQEVKLYNMDNTFYKSGSSRGEWWGLEPTHINFACDVNDWNTRDSTMSPISSGNYRLRIVDIYTYEDRYVDIIINQDFSGDGDFIVVYQNGIFSLDLNNRGVTISESKDWDVPVTFSQYKSDGLTSVGLVSIWNGTTFEDRKTPPYTYYVTPEVYLFQADTNVIDNQKFYDYSDGNQSVINYVTLTINSEWHLSLQSNFNSIANGIIIDKIFENVSGVSGTIQFSDPWIYDFEEPPYGKRNRGTSAIFHQRQSPFNPNIDGTNEGKLHKGVFLNQDYNIPGNPFYQVKVDLEQIITLAGGDHKFFFQNWSYDPAKISLQYPSSNQTGVVFKSSDPTTLTANLKGQLVSSESNGFTSNGQRKIVRDNSGYYHCVYSSLGKVYYTKSTTTDFGGTWTQDVDVFSAISQNAKNPSIDFYNNHIAIVAEISDGEESSYIGLYRSDNSSVEWIDYIDVPYYGSSFPVVSFTNDEILIIYKTSALSPLKYKRDSIIHPDGWGIVQPVTLPGSTSNSKNPTITNEKINARLYVAWQEGTSAIKYLYAPPLSYNNRYFDPVETVTTNSGYSTHTNPSISLALTGTVVSWTGGRKESVLNKINGTEALVWVNRALIRVKGSSWGDFTAVSSDVNFTNNNSSLSSTGESVIAFSQNGGQSAKWLKRVGGYYSEVSSLSHNGLLVNVSNGSGIANQKAMVFNTTSLPYPINRSTTAFNTLAKIALDTVITYGRTGIISKQGVEFVFCAEDILLDDENIKFIERVDTLPILNLIELNTAAKTNDFYLTGSSNLFFSLYYLVINPELAASVLSDEDYFNFKLELVNTATNQVAGTFDNITYTKQNVYDYENLSYKIDCFGIEEGNYYLRIVADANNFNVIAISNNQNDDGQLLKKHYYEINYSGNTTPSEYAIEQNYPNPFNPSTAIRYQLPKDGIVTLKIYDVLGSEIATLVNEEKPAGKYEVSFNASSLSSGVYIYKIQAGTFINSKKMLLLK